MPGSEHVSVEGADGLLHAAERSGVGGSLVIDHGREGLLGTPASIGHDLLQVIEALIAQTIDLALREGRLQGHLGEERHGLSQVRAGHLDVHRQAVPAGTGAHLRTQAFGRLDEGHRVAFGGALGHGTSGEHGRSSLACGLAGGATAGIAADDELGLQQGAPGHMAADDGEPVVERRALEGREVVLAWLAGLRPLVEDGQGVTHAEASSVARGT